jgi:hypothetical protein
LLATFSLFIGQELCRTQTIEDLSDLVDGIQMVKHPVPSPGSPKWKPEAEKISYSGMLVNIGKAKR